MSGEGENFLARWSRRKKEARRAGDGNVRGSPAASPPAPAPSTGEGKPPDMPALPPVEGLRGLESEYRDFLQPDVDESLKRSALKKLFQDPHFNRMDGLDTYIDDYTKADPIPEAMLRALNQARGLVFDAEEKRDERETRTLAQPAKGETPPAALPFAESDAAQDDRSAQHVPPAPSTSRPA